MSILHSYLPTANPYSLSLSNISQVKRIIGQQNATLKKNQPKDEKKPEKGEEIVREIPQVSSALFFQYNTALVPPYNVLVDTNVCRSLLCAFRSWMGL